MRVPFEPTSEQARAIRSLGGPLCISAGAGSGKTRVLAERFVAAVDPRASVEGWAPAGVDEVLTVTFTDKAAGEIAERVRRVLLEHGLVAEARRVDEAWISTIHGLCTRLLRAHALEAGLDPRFGVVSAVEAGSLREEVLEALLREELAAGRATGLVGAYGVAGTMEHLSTLHDRLRAMGATSGDVVVAGARGASDLLGNVLEATRDWSRRLSAYPSPSPTLERVIASAAGSAETLAVLRDHGLGEDRELAREVLRVLHGLRLPLNVGGAKELVAHCADERRGLLDEAVRAVAAPLEDELIDLAGAFEERYAAAKSERGVLDFEDLQLGALALLRDPKGPASRYRALFRLVMIDEFQDTNAVQAALADLLADDDLCTVGDARQSIYGFRYADVDVYRAHTQRMIAAGAATAQLTANFRSHPDVLAFVNGAFATPALFGADFLRLGHGRDEKAAPALLPAGEPRVALLLVNRQGRRGDAAREVEADAVAGRLRALADAGVEQGDMVMLLRAMTHADEYAAALRRHDLDYTIVAGGSFFGRPEVEAVRAFLRAASNPLDDEALAIVLASGLTAMSDDGLARLRRASEEAGRAPLWRVMPATELGEGDAAAARLAGAAIESARAREGRRSVAEIIHRACEELDFDLHLLARGPDGRRAYANVLKLARLAEEFEHSGGAGTRDFLSHLALKERFRDREAPASVIDERVDAVRIMTVHAAKGLEFPVAAVPELGRDLTLDTGALVLEKEGAGARLALVLPDDGAVGAEERRSAWASDARARARVREIEEEQRLLYVACTRAREVLVLSGAGSLDKPGGDRPLGWLREALGLDGVPEGASELEIEGARIAVVRLEEDAPLGASPPRGRSVVETSPPGPAEESRGTCTDSDPGRPAPPSTPPAVSYSAMRLYATCGLRYHMEKVVRIGGLAEAGTGGPLRFGVAVHAALALVGPDASAPAPERLGAIARRWGLRDTEVPRLHLAVEGFLCSDACREAYGEQVPAHEVPFAVPLDAATLVGKMDLVSHTGDGALIVDYKTGADALGEGPHERYRDQADCYGLAALAGGARRVDVVFVGVETSAEGKPRQVVFPYAADDEARLRVAISARAAALSTGPYEPLARYDPAACDGCPAARSLCPVRVPARSGRSRA
ncbi:MAG TPA: UvrD-helicase domain-containing protein [Coriobacteriia bacterium]